MQLQEAVHARRPENQDGHTMHMCDLWACGDHHEALSKEDWHLRVGEDLITTDECQSVSPRCFSSPGVKRGARGPGSGAQRQLSGRKRLWNSRLWEKGKSGG